MNMWSLIFDCRKRIEKNVRCNLLSHKLISEACENVLETVQDRNHVITKCTNRTSYTLILRGFKGNCDVSMFNVQKITSQRYYLFIYLNHSQLHASNKL